jgi:hypothetical protein
MVLSERPKRAESPGPPTERHFTMPRKAARAGSGSRGRDRWGDFGGCAPLAACCLLLSTFCLSRLRRDSQKTLAAYCLLLSAYCLLLSALCLLLSAFSQAS